MRFKPRADRFGAGQYNSLNSGVDAIEVNTKGTEIAAVCRNVMVCGGFCAGERRGIGRVSSECKGARSEKRFDLNMFAELLLWRFLWRANARFVPLIPVVLRDGEWGKCSKIKSAAGWGTRIRT